MAGTYLTDLLQVIERAGIPVAAEPGWQTRARGGGGFRSNPPRGIVVHHTASNTSLESDVRYMTYNATYAPIANLYVSRAGTVVVMAAGGTNHAGSGRWPGPGLIPDNSANSYAIGIEVANNGVGQPYPEAQTKTLVWLCAILAAHYRVPVIDIVGHYEYAPTRKIDPAGPSPWMIHGDSARRWNMNAFRADVAAFTKEDSIVATSIELLTPPKRILDSRDFGIEAGRLGSERPGDNGRRTIGVPDGAGIAGVQATFTVVGAAGPGFLTVWEGGGAVPTVSALNFNDAGAIANTTVVAMNTDSFEIFLQGDAHLIIDLVALYR